MIIVANMSTKVMRTRANGMEPRSSWKLSIKLFLAFTRLVFGIVILVQRSPCVLFVYRRPSCVVVELVKLRLVSKSF